MRLPKALRTKRWAFLAVGAVLVIAALGGGAYYHHYEYQNLHFNLSDGGSITISRHNFNMMTAQQKYATLHPVNENALHPCIGNTIDTCIATPSIDFWPVGSEGASNPQLQYTTSSQQKEIMGRIVSNEHNILQLKTSSGRLFSIDYPLDSIANFNQNYSSSYKLTVGTGDAIFVTYYSTTAGVSTTITSPQIIRSSLILAGNTKSGPITKY